MDATKEMTSRNLLRGLDVRAVVLVGGRDFGRCPLAAHLPTALWPVAGRTVLARLLDHLAEAGLGHVAVCCARDDSAAVEAACGETPLDVTLVVEDLAAGTAGCLRDAVAHDPGDLILVLSAGMLAPPAIEDLVAAHQAGGAALTLVFNPGADHDTGPGRPAEIYLCRPEVLRHIPSAGYFDIKERLIPSILRTGGTIRPVVLEQDVGNFHNRTGYLDSLYVLFREDARDGLRVLSRGRTGETFVFGAAKASVHPTARICGPVLIGDHARLAEGVVVIGPTVIGPNVAVDAGSVIVRSAVWADAHVGAQCEIRQSIVDRHAELPEGAEVLERTAFSGGASGVSDMARRRVFGRMGERARSWWERLPEGFPRSGRELAYLAGGAIVLAALLWSYWSTLLDLWEEWNRSDEYSAGLLVPILAVYVVWLRRKDLRSLPVRPALLLGVGGFLLAQAVRALGLDFYSSAERFSIILSLAAVVLLILGRKYLAKLATILLFLCLMLPWPHRVQGLITLPLQRWSTTSAVFCLELTGHEVQQEGNEIAIGNTRVAVAEACNGLRMIMAFFVISGLVVLLVKRAWWEKLIILASSLPIAFLCNTLRLAVTAKIFTIVGARWQGWFHDWGGYAMMPVALALVVGELWLLALLTTPPPEVEPAIIARRQAPRVSDP